MAELNMGQTMDAIAAACINGKVAKKVFAWPADSVVVPCVVVGYPKNIEYDYTFARGSDRAEFPVYYITGRASDRNARDELSAIVANSGSMKRALDGDLDEFVNSCAVQTCEVTTIKIGDVDYIAAMFTVEIIS